MPFPAPVTATEFQTLVLDWLQGRIDLGDDLEAICDRFHDLSEQFLSFDEWEQFCIANDMA